MWGKHAMHRHRLYMHFITVGLQDPFYVSWMTTLQMSFVHNTASITAPNHLALNSITFHLARWSIMMQILIVFLKKMEPCCTKAQKDDYDWRHGRKGSSAWPITKRWSSTAPSDTCLQVVSKFHANLDGLPNSNNF